jgi:hypothetical protein
MGVCTSNLYKWRAKFGELNVSLILRIKEPEKKSRRLNKICVGETPKTEIISEAPEKVVGPSQRNKTALKVVKLHGICIWVECQVLSISGSC